MTNRTLTSEAFLRHFIGYDRAVANASAFPPHNIEKINEDRYVLTLAVAGFSRDDVEIYTHQGTLTISGRKKKIKRTQEELYAHAQALLDSGAAMLHQGITFRDWDRQFNLGEFIEVVDASMEHGLLVITLDRRVPEQHKPKQIDIRA